MTNPRLNHYFNLLTGELSAKGTLTIAEAFAVCAVHNFDDLKAFNRVIRAMAKAGLRKDNRLAAPEAL